MRRILILALPGVPLLALAACHEPTGRVPHDNGPGLIPAHVQQAPDVQEDGPCGPLCRLGDGRTPNPDGPRSPFGSGKNRITGTPGDDVLEGTPGPDRIDGGAGNDVICGGPCPDLPSRPKGEW